MFINVKFFATFRDLLGLKELELKTGSEENLKLIDLLESLFQKFGEKLQTFLDLLMLIVTKKCYDTMLANFFTLEKKMKTHGLNGTLFP